MTFLNGLLAMGAAAFAVPLLIHLLHRGRTTTVDWGAMHLLQVTKSSNSSRIQWQHLLLLLLRCMIPILLALAMSRPLIPSWQTVGNGANVAVAIVLDDSMSMFAKSERPNDQNGKSRFADACFASAKILRELPSGSTAAVFLGGATPENRPSQDPNELAIDLEQLALRSVPSGEYQIPASLQAAHKWLSNSSLANRQIILVSDLQTNEWKKDIRISGLEPAEWIAQQPVVPELALLNLGPAKRNINTNNLSVESLLVNASLPCINREIQIQSTIRNHGFADSESCFLVLLDNDFEIERQEITVAANSASTILSRWTPKKTGDHVLKLQILRDDDLIADNTLSVVSNVFGQIPVVLVDGDRKSEGMKSETDFLRRALAPFSGVSSSEPSAERSRPERQDMFAVKVIGPEELDESLLQDCRALCLCNVSNLTPQQLVAVRTFVEKGNGLLTFPGDRVQQQSYSEWPIANGTSGIRLGAIGSREPIPSQSLPTLAAASQTGSDQTDGIAVRPVVRLQVQGTDFAPLREMSKAGQRLLEQIEFKFRTPLKLEPSSLEPPVSAAIAVRFDDGQPWILESKLGQGRSLWISTAIDDDDSNFPSKPVFVPWVQRLLAYAARLETTEGNLAAGATWSIDTGKFTKLSIAKPDGSFESFETDQEGKVDLPALRLIGSYIARPNLASSASLQNQEADVDRPKFVGTGVYAASVSQSGVNRTLENGFESNLSFLDQQEAVELAKRWNATLATSVEELRAANQRTWLGREIWFWFWTALVVCFLAEVGLEQALSPRMRRARSV